MCMCTNNYRYLTKKSINMVSVGCWRGYKRCLVVKTMYFYTWNNKHCTVNVERKVKQVYV